MVNVLKATGDREPFSEAKVRSSIHRAGIPDELQNQVVEHIKTKLYENIPTSQIYHHITEFLEKSPSPYSKTRYGLKQAIMDLGPTGYPFEDFVSEILKTQGYKTEVRKILSGKCITHEIDIVATKGSNKCMIECKFHNRPGTRSQIHTALYTKARFDDVVEKNDLNQAWLVTNTKVTSDALEYALCMNMKIISWSHPEGESLRELIEKARLCPITALTTLSQAQKQKLLDEHIVLCKSIAQNPLVLDGFGLPEDKKQTILSELSFTLNQSP